MNADVVCGKGAVIFAASSDAYKLNHTCRNTAEVILHAAVFVGKRNAHFIAHNFAKLYVDVFNFRHHAFVKIIFLAELFAVISVLKCFKNIEIGTEVALNILEATRFAMTQAVQALSVQPDCALIDGNGKPGLPIEQRTIIKGDSKSISVAAASILAKVTRDRLMYEYDEMYPQYGFAKHKGYGTADHIAAIKKYGPCPIHRKSFIGHFV